MRYRKGMMSVETKTAEKPAVRYLKVYNADIDWQPHLDSLEARLKNNIDEFKKRIACTILLPFYEPNTIQDPPQNLLFYCHTWTQYSSRDWVDEYQKVKDLDTYIEKVRNKCLDMGIIFPHEYNPNTRQAFNWLYEHAEKDITPENRESVVKKLKALVYAYGGVVVCSVFQKPELEYKIKKIPNWRSGYFFERLIHEVYDGEQIEKIKNQELTKIRNVDPKLIKTIRTKE